MPLMPSFFFLLDVPEVPDDHVGGQLKLPHAALAAASESVSSLPQSIVYLRQRLRQPLQPVQALQRQLLTSSSTSSDGLHFEDELLQYRLGCLSVVFSLLMCMVILYQYSAALPCCMALNLEGC